MTDLNEQDIERLSAYLDGMLNEAERLEVEALLKSADSRYQAELTSLQHTIDLVKALPTYKAPRSFALTREMVGLSSVQAKPVTRRTKQINFYAMSFLSAAASFIMLVLGIVLWTSNTPAQTMLNGSVASVPTYDLSQADQSSMVYESDEPAKSTAESIVIGSVVGGSASAEIDPSDAEDMPLVFSAVPPMASPSESVEQEESHQSDLLLRSSQIMDDAETGATALGEMLDEELVDLPMLDEPNIEASVPITAETMEQDVVLEHESGEQEPLVAVDAVVSDTTANVEHSEMTSSDLPALAVILLLFGGLFALIAITGIYWARKIQA